MPVPPSKNSACVQDLPPLTDRSRKVAPLAASSVSTFGLPGTMASWYTWPACDGFPCRRKVLPPLVDVKTSLMLKPGCGYPWSEQAIAMSDGGDAATALGDRTPAGHLNESLAQVLPLLAVVRRSGATPAQAECPKAVRSFCGATPRTWVQLPEPTADLYSFAGTKLPSALWIETYASPPE